MGTGRPGRRRRLLSHQRRQPTLELVRQPPSPRATTPPAAADSSSIAGPRPNTSPRLNPSMAGRNTAGSSSNSELR